MIYYLYIYSLFSFFQQKELDNQLHIDPLEKEIKYNPKYEDLFAPVLGPHKQKSKYHEIKRNTLAGYVEPAHISDFAFDTQRKTFASYGKY